MTDQNVQILDQLTAVNLNVSVWTARKKLTAEDFGGVELPPEELASLGSKKICDPESLKIFTALKARAVWHLDKIGVRFLGGWAIPDDQRDYLFDRLVVIKNEFLDAKDTFLNNYSLAVQNWIDKHPGWERLIADSPVSIEEIRKRLTFSWQFYKVVPPDQSIVSDSLHREVASLGSTLFGEIAKEAHAIWNKVYAGKTEVSHKALSPLKSMRQKLTGLAFVEPKVAPVADLIEDTLQSMPKRGLISGQSLLLLQGLVTALKDPALILEHVEKVMAGQSSSSFLLNLANSPLEAGNIGVQGGLKNLKNLESLAGQDPMTGLLGSPLDNELDFEDNDNGSAASNLDRKSEEDSFASLDDLPSESSEEQTNTSPGLDSLGLW
jgi:hypothetical protein